MTTRLWRGPTDTLAAHEARYGHLPRVPARSGSTPGALVDEVERAGLLGRGGGWFPTHRKLRAVVDASSSRRGLGRRRAPVVLANGMEGEPASGKDAALLSSSPHLVLDGVSLAARTIGASEAVVAVHRDSPLVGVLETALEERAQAGLDDIPLQFVTPPARYVASEESALSHWVGDGVATPVYPDRPFQRGVEGRPTLVQNVETLAHLALIARHGGAWFASTGAPDAPGTTLVTVGGAVAAPGVVEVPTGTPVDEILARCGGPTQSIRGYLTGGYGGAWVEADRLHRTPWAPASVRDAGGVIGASVLWVMGDDACPLDELQRVSAWMAGESAGQCGPCIFGLPDIADDLRALALRQVDQATMQQLGTRLRLVTGRGGCKHPDGTSRFVATGLTAFADEVSAHLEHRCSIAGQRTATPASALPVPPVRVSALDPDGRDFR